MASLASINVKFSADLKQFSSEMQNSLREIEKFGSKLQNIGRSMSTYITAPLLVAGAAGVKFASDYEESLNKVDAAFKSSSDQVKEFAKTSLTSSGIAEGTALDMAASFGDMSTSMGLSTSAAAKMSTELVTLAGDLASFKNIGIEQANTALTGIFSGETESLKRLGVVMTEANLQAFALSQGIQTQIKDMDQASKVNLRYAYIMSVTKNAQGDFAKTSGGAANQMRIFQESMKQLAQQFGSIILPVFTKIVNGLNEVITYFGSLSTETKTTIVVIAGIAAAIGPLVLAIGAVISLMPTLIAGFAALTGPIGLTVVALSAVAAVVVTQWKPIKKILVDIANYFIDLYNSSTVFRVAVEGVILVFKSLWAQVKFVFNAILSTAQFVVRNIFNYFATLGKLVKGVLTFDGAAIKKALSEGFSGGLASAKTFFNNIKKDSASANAEISKNISQAVNNSLNKKVARITIPKESVDAKGVSEAVSEGTEAGIKAGVKNVKRADLSPVEIELKPALGTVAGKEEQIAKMKEFAKALEIEPTSLITTALTVEQMTALISAAMANTTESVSVSQQKMVENATSFNEQFSSVWQSTIGGFAENFGALIGQFAEGGFSLSNVGNLFLTTLADMAIQVGKIAISVGIAVAGIKKALQSLNPVVAIAAGVALIALGTIAKSALSSAAGGGDIPKFADGGIVGGTSYYGDKILARVNSGELILNQKQQQRLSSQLDSKVPINVSLGGGFVIDGNKLRLVLDRTDARKNRIG